MEQATEGGRALAADWSDLLRRAQALGPQERFRVASVGYRRCRLAAWLHGNQHGASPRDTAAQSCSAQVVSRHLALATCSEVSCVAGVACCAVDGCASGRLHRSLQVGDKPEDAVPVVWLLLHPSKHCAPELSGSSSFGAPIQVRLRRPHPQSFSRTPWLTETHWNSVRGAHGGAGLPRSESRRGPLLQLDKALPDYIARADAFNAGRDRVWAVGGRFRMFFGGKKIGPHKARAGAAPRLPQGPSTAHARTATRILRFCIDCPTPMH